jgi:hypothetical protein
MAPRRARRNAWPIRIQKRPRSTRPATAGCCQIDIALRSHRQRPRVSRVMAGLCLRRPEKRPLPQKSEACLKIGASMMTRCALATAAGSHLHARRDGAVWGQGGRWVIGAWVFNMARVSIARSDQSRRPSRHLRRRDSSGARSIDGAVWFRDHRALVGRATRNDAPRGYRESERWVGTVGAAHEVTGGRCRATAMRLCLRRGRCLKSRKVASQ